MKANAQYWLSLAAAPTFAFMALLIGSMVAACRTCSAQSGRMDCR